MATFYKGACYACGGGENADHSGCKDMPEWPKICGDCWQWKFSEVCEGCPGYAHDESFDADAADAADAAYDYPEPRYAVATGSPERSDNQIWAGEAYADAVEPAGDGAWDREGNVYILGAGDEIVAIFANHDVPEP
jgi:hypothetical protein